MTTTQNSSECSALSPDEECEVRAQMRLLDARWEALRTRALDKQSAIHDRLMQVQQLQLDQLRQWLTATEDRISKMPDLTHNVDLCKQVEDQQRLKYDMENKQKEVDSLSELVVVVDDSNSENGKKNHMN